MGEEIAISLDNVSKCFKRYAHPVDRLKELLLPGKTRSDEFWALRGINLEIPKGKTVGIVGRNGSGKSTLLQIIAGTLTPTTGTVQVKGRVSALLELGSGFNPEFTGRQNVFFNGRLLGLSQREIEEKFDEIAGFADIGDFIDQPVKTYSSGMFVRLAFAVAVNVNPDILIVDEALAVGDVVFQHRCMRRMRTLMDSGVTTLFVSHDSGAIKTLCNSAVMIHDGKIYTSGLPNTVIIEYMKLLTELELELDIGQPEVEAAKSSNPNNSHHLICNGVDVKESSSNIKLARRGNGKAVIEEVSLLNQFEEYV
ncbi:ABC transporter ATP-binding protein, partial [Aetokthonos hydrillicola Thurmond2011]